MINKKDRPLVLRRMAALAALGLSVFALDAANAASMGDCPAQLDALDDAMPNGMTEIWAEVLRDDLASINALTDTDSVVDAQVNSWSMYRALLDNPDPDGDGFAVDPAITQKQMLLMDCLYDARAAELGGAEDASSSGDDAAEPERVYTDNRESAPEPLNRSQWFVEADYPVSAMREERSGAVRYDVTVGADGLVAGCQASGPPNSADLEIATCDAILARARFNPATDAAGNPVAGEYSGTITWSIPE